MYNYHRWQPISVLPDDLIAFAWSAPMRDLAARMELSDAGLKKLLKGYGVVTPPQGHWNRVRAGRAVVAPPKSLPRRPGETGRIHVDARFAPFVAQAAPMPSSGPFATKEVPEDFGDLRARELKAIGRVAVPRTLESPHPGLKWLVNKEAARRAKAAANRWHWDEPRFDTPLWQRRIRLFNGLFLALAKRGHGGEIRENEQSIRSYARIGNMRVGISIDIVGKHATVMRAGKKVPAPDLPATTTLRLRIDDVDDQAAATWQDDEEGRLEAKVGQIAAELVVAGEAMFRRKLRENEEQAERERVEREAKEERERIELERRRLARLAELNEQRVTDLRRSGELLRLAADVRILVVQVREAVTQRADIDPETLADWEHWALAEADRIDPITSGQFLTHLRPPRLEQ